MALLAKIKEDINQAMKNSETLKLEVLRGLLSAVHNREIELRGKGAELTEEEVLTELGREAKKRKEANQIYAEAGRTDLAAKESEELTIIENYLPPKMDQVEIEAIARRVIDSGATDFGKAMGAVIKETKRRAEPAVVKEIVERVLAQEKKEA